MLTLSFYAVHDANGLQYWLLCGALHAPPNRSASGEKQRVFRRMRPYVLVSGDFVQTGGMDVANYWLARHLSDLGHEVHLVAHHASDD